MSKSPQFKQAIINNLERLNSIHLDINKSGTIHDMVFKDYSKPLYLKNQKNSSVFRHFFLQKVF